jgi:hypothetical protein
LPIIGKIFEINQVRKDTEFLKSSSEKESLVKAMNWA